MTDSALRTVFTGGLVFDGTGAAPAPADGVVADGRIADVGTDLDGDTHVDCTGRTLLPGLFDCHVHLTLNGIGLLGALQKPFSYQFFEAAVNLRRTLEAGITTVRDAAGADLGVKQAVEDGLVAGPPGPDLHRPDQPDRRPRRQLDALGPVRGSRRTAPGPPALADGPDEMRRTARTLLRAGAEVLKVCATGGVLSPRDDPRHSQFTPAELDILVAEATAQGRYVMAHAQGAEGIKNAVRAGVRSIEHGIHLDDEAIDLMLRHGTWLVPTLIAPVSVIRAAGSGVQIPDAMVRKAEEVTEAHADSVRRAADAGVRIAMGTDSGIGPHGANLDELPLMEACGMTPGEVLAATTSSAARLLGHDDLGTVEPGRRADLVLVEGNAYDLTALSSNVTEVWKDGVRAALRDKGE